MAEKENPASCAGSISSFAQPDNLLALLGRTIAGRREHEHEYGKNEKRVSLHR
jgi:hypothetical protein